eukprot:CAMPEP_0175047176 /NCGR_PEP_ID=MMETSP0052_2-20121109/5443_1 /TAXON_ID=51329 ORGANISM="Polytomella parva, Strain SAG 63-3" /NCGR_SAMPLE_ID=MMETSP0052_2 /ASSEMBLY_ACC=CAM_ASM_000194 /LENGTH=309 /DNA_ID=CAMNT_0016311009 /DNA_START=322 /DNA_END=1248 /DNA_ORIENTATION=+
MTWIAPFLYQQNIARRRRAICFLHYFFEVAPRRMTLSPSVIAGIEDYVVALLNDKDFNMRFLAAKTCKVLLIGKGDTEVVPDDPVVRKLIEVYSEEPVEKVRAAIATAIPLNNGTLGRLIEFTRDVSDKVAADMYDRLSLVPLRTVPNRPTAPVVLLSYGLSERRPAVRAAAIRLMSSWLLSCTVSSSFSSLSLSPTPSSLSTSRFPSALDSGSHSPVSSSSSLHSSLVTLLKDTVHMAILEFLVLLGAKDTPDLGNLVLATLVAEELWDPLRFLTDSIRVGSSPRGMNDAWISSVVERGRERGEGGEG